MSVVKMLGDDGNPTAAMMALGDALLRGSGSGEPMKTLKEAQTEAMHQATKDYLGQVLTVANGNVTTAAKASGVARESFHRLMRKHGVDASVYRPKPDAGTPG